MELDGEEPEVFEVRRLRERRASAHSL